MNINANYVPPAHMLHPEFDEDVKADPVPRFTCRYDTLRVRVPAPQDATFGDRHRSPRERARGLERPAYERMTKLWDNARLWAGNLGFYDTVANFAHQLSLRMDKGYGYSFPWDYAANRAGAYEIVSPVMRLVGYYLGYEDWGIHPGVLIALQEASPISARLLFCQAPRRSREAGVGTDKVVYSKDYDALVRGNTTRTTIGRYLTRMFPTLSEARVRDISALVGAKRTFGIATDMEQMLEMLNEGPRSCMKDDGFDRHPYRVYHPDMGWGLAYGLTTVGEKTMYPWYGACACRALVNVKTKKFVRTYGMPSSEDSTSPDSDELRVWLLSQGFTKAGCWSGHDIKHIEYNGSTVMPYVDGDTNRIFTTSTRGILRIGHGSRFIGTADETGGYLDGGSDDADWECSDCGSDCWDDDLGYWVGRHEEDKVCGDCIDEYRMVAGRRRNDYYVKKDCSVQVGDDWYDEDYLEDNDIVKCAETDEWVHKDDTFYCEYHGAEVDDGVDSTHIRDEYGQDGAVCSTHLDEYLAQNELRTVVDNTMYPHGRTVTEEEKAAQLPLDPWPHAPAREGMEPAQVSE